MDPSTSNGDDDAPRLVLSPTSSPVRQLSEEEPGVPRRRLHHRQSRSEGNNGRHIQLEPPALTRARPSSIYMGSYSHSPRRRSRVSLADSTRTPASSAPVSPRISFSNSHLEELLQDMDVELDTYGVEELRDNFFDGAFLKPPKMDHEDLMRDAEYTLPAALRQTPLSLHNFLPKQWHAIKGVVRSVTTTRAGVKLTKSFLAFFITYILCLVPAVRHWLGHYNYIMCLSAILNHSGRTIGAQIDGVVLTIVGSATGLGWGAFALWLSDCTAVARRGYGGILAAFLVVFMGTIAALRSYYIRSYQFVLCAGIAVSYTCLADTSDHVHWRKLYDYGIPWLFGQAIALLVCCIVFPDAGARSLAVSLHNAFAVMQDGLVLPHPDSISLHRQLALTFVNLSQAYRDLVLDISLTRFRPSDVEQLRNLMQGVIRSLLSLKMETYMFNNFKQNREHSASGLREPPPFSLNPDDSRRGSSTDPAQSSRSDTVVDIDGPRRRSVRRTPSEEQVVKLVADKLAEPTLELLSWMRTSLSRCDAVLMEMSGHRKYLGPPDSVSSDIIGALTELRKAMIKYDEEEDDLMKSSALPPTYSHNQEIVEFFLFVHPIRQAASSVEALLVKVMEMQQRHPGWRIYLPSYPLAKALQRTNAQVRHDRGGVTAGYYFRSQAQLAKMMKGMANVYKPSPRQRNGEEAPEPKVGITRMDTIGKYEEEEIAMNQKSNISSLRYRLWTVLHRLQGFETRFALKVAISTSLLSVPAWLDASRGWWNANESWWAVVVVWVMAHPRVGGNFQDLVTRAFCAALGAVWAGVAYGAGDGSPYVMAVFAAIFMIPMMYRFTQSSHPRSGIVGCMSFAVISLGIREADGLPSVVWISWTRGLAFVVGVVASVVTNWILWPFVARHELRKALSSMLIYSSIIYRSVVAKYVYYEAGHEPGEKEIAESGS